MRELSNVVLHNVFEIKSAEVSRVVLISSHLLKARLVLVN